MLSGFQRYFCMQYTTGKTAFFTMLMLCYQDFKDTFVCNTQQEWKSKDNHIGCVIRISKILLYAIHNHHARQNAVPCVVLSGFQRYFCMQYTTPVNRDTDCHWLCYQDFKDTFVCNTQPTFLLSNPIAVVLSGFQRYFCMQYTTL